MLEYRDGEKRGLKGWSSNKQVGWGGWAPNFDIKLRRGTIPPAGGDFFDWGGVLVGQK